MRAKTKKHTIQTKAEEMRAAIGTAKHDDGTEYVVLKNGAPQWMIDVCHAAHGDMMPDDWRYRMISDALDILADRKDDDGYHESLDNDVSIYNSDRTAWLASHLDRAGYVDDAIDEYGWDKERGIFGALGIGEYKEREEVLYLIKAALEELI